MSEDPFVITYNKETTKKVVYMFGERLEPGFRSLPTWRRGDAEPPDWTVELDVNGCIKPGRSSKDDIYLLLFAVC